MKVLIIFIFFLLVGDQAFSITPEKLYTTDRNKTYYIEQLQKYDWFESFAKCRRMNMNLASFDSQVKWTDFVLMFKKQFGVQLQLWISGYAMGEKRQFTWMSTGEEFTFTNWTVGNPDFAQEKEYCVQIGNGPHQEWNDNTCTKKFGFICEVKEDLCRNVHEESAKPKNYIVFNTYQKK